MPSMKAGQGQRGTCAVNHRLEDGMTEVDLAAVVTSTSGGRPALEREQ